MAANQAGHVKIGRFVTCAGALTLLARVPSAGGQVHVVDDQPGPGVDFTDLQAAIDAAADGDVVLIKAGTYGTSGTIVAESKSLALVADTGQQVTLTSPLAIRAALPGSRVVLRGIDVDAPAGGSALVVEYDAFLLAEDGDFRSDAAAFGSFLYPGAQVLQFARFVGVRCSIEGSPGDALAPAGAPGLRCQPISAAALHDARLVGGAGFGGPGGPGASIVTTTTSQPTFVFASGSAFLGGAGGAGQSQPPAAACGDGAAGGAGIQWSPGLGGPLSELVGLGVAVHGGAGGPAGSGSPGCSAGPSGAPIAGVGGSATALAGPARSFEATSPVREGQSMVLRFRGEPGELVFVAASAALDFVYVPELQGVRVVAPTQVFFQGVVPAAGVLVKTVPIQDLGPGVEGAVIGLQAAFFAAPTGVHLGPPSVAVLMDASL